MTPPKKAAKKKAAKKTSKPKTRRLVIKDNGKFNEKAFKKIKPGDFIQIVAKKGICFDIKVKIEIVGCGGQGRGGPIIIHS